MILLLLSLDLWQKCRATFTLLLTLKAHWETATWNVFSGSDFRAGHRLVAFLLRSKVLLWLNTRMGGSMWRALSLSTMTCAPNKLVLFWEVDLFHQIIQNLQVSPKRLSPKHHSLSVSGLTFTDQSVCSSLSCFLLPGSCMSLSKGDSAKQGCRAGCRLTSCFSRGDLSFWRSWLAHIKMPPVISRFTRSTWRACWGGTVAKLVVSLSNENSEHCFQQSKLILRAYW